MVASQQKSQGLLGSCSLQTKAYRNFLVWRKIFPGLHTPHGIAPCICRNCPEKSQGSRTVRVTSRHERSMPPLPHRIFSGYLVIFRGFGIFRDVNTVGRGVFDNKREWPQAKKGHATEKDCFFVQLCCTFLGERRDEGKFCFWFFE